LRLRRNRPGYFVGIGLDITLKQLEEQAQQCRTQFFVYLTTLGFMVITVLSIKDIDLLLNNQQITLPLLNVGIPPLWILVIGPALLLVVFCNLHIHWQRFIKRIDEAEVLHNIKTDDLNRHLFPFALYQAAYHPLQGLTGVVERFFAKAVLFSLLIPTQLVFFLLGLKLQEINISLWLGYILFSSFKQTTAEVKNKKKDFKNNYLYFIDRLLLVVFIMSSVCLTHINNPWLLKLCLFFIFLALSRFLYICNPHADFLFSAKKRTNQFEKYIYTILSIAFSLSIYLGLGLQSNPEKLSFHLNCSYSLLSPSKEMLVSPIVQNSMSLNPNYRKKAILDPFFHGLYWLDLSNKHLKRVDFRSSVLLKTIFYKTVLINAKMNHVNAAYSNFMLADFTNAEMENINLYNASLNRCNLANAKLSRAYLYQADLSGANLENTEFLNSYLSGATLSRVYFKSKWNNSKKQFLPYYGFGGENLCQAKTLKGTTMDEWLSRKLKKLCPEKL
jgi:uncharacterized protein YjbI with pentapeptide repeats